MYAQNRWLQSGRSNIQESGELRPDLETDDALGLVSRTFMFHVQAKGQRSG